MNQIESSVDGLFWPSMPAPHATAVLALLYQLDKSQWWTPESLRRFQYKQFAEVLRHAYKNIPFYFDSFNAAGFDPEKFGADDQLSRIPILPREQVQQLGKALYSRNIPRFHGDPFEISTSGSTGSPVTVRCTFLESVFWRVLYLRDHEWHARDLSKKLAAIRYDKQLTAPPPHGKTAQVWGTPEYGTFKTGGAALLSVESSAPEQAAWLIRHNPEYLMSYPTNILSLARHFISKGITLPGLMQVRTVGEILGPEVRQACRDAWNVPVVDMYSCQELGVVALQCPKHEHYHVQSENLIVEVLNERNQSCGPGETGRVVISGLHNFAMPLIRYELGDYAEVGEPCDCGRGLPVLTRILGRQRNMLVYPDGRTIWPAFGINRLAKEFPIKQFQFVQKSREGLEARLVTFRPMSSAEEARFMEIVTQRLRYPFVIEFTYLENIPRSKSGKYEDFISEITNA